MGLPSMSMTSAVAITPTTSAVPGSRVDPSLAVQTLATVTNTMLTGSMVASASDSTTAKESTQADPTSIPGSYLSQDTSASETAQALSLQASTTIARGISFGTSTASAQDPVASGTNAGSVIMSSSVIHAAIASYVAQGVGPTLTASLMQTQSSPMGSYSDPAAPENSGNEVAIAHVVDASTADNDPARVSPATTHGTIIPLAFAGSSVQSSTRSSGTQSADPMGQLIMDILSAVDSADGAAETSGTNGDAGGTYEGTNISSTTIHASLSTLTMALQSAPISGTSLGSAVDSTASIECIASLGYMSSPTSSDPSTSTAQGALHSISSNQLPEVAQDPSAGSTAVSLPLVHTMGASSSRLPSGTAVDPTSLQASGISIAPRDRHWMFGLVLALVAMYAVNSI